MPLSDARDRLSFILSTLFLILTGIIVYHNSFSGVFVLDDSYIRDNPQIHHLWPLWDVVADTNRPILNFTLAVNYALGGMDVRGYHAVNLFIHIAAGFVLFGIIRRTLCSQRLHSRYSRHALWLSWSVAALWLVHPLQTASVTYIIQRAESLMGLFYFLTLYLSIRRINSHNSQPEWWGMAAVAACALGMGVKEVMVTAPIMVLIYERIFFAPSFRDIFARRWKFYLGLALTWLIPVFLLTHSHHYAKSAGFDFKGFTPYEYALTQPGVILHYLRLAFYPDGLCLDYQWPLAQSIEAVFFPSLVIGSILILTVIVLSRRPVYGFPGVWFFLILSISSSFIPIQDIAFEHRMYLPLAAVIVLIVFTLEYVSRYVGRTDSLQMKVHVCLIFLIALTWGSLTYQRNQLYRDKVSLWQDVLRKRPDNARAHNQMGLALIQKGQFNEAMKYFSRAAQLRPQFVNAYNNMGLIFLNQGRGQVAIDYFLKALQLKSDYLEARNNLGLALAHEGKLEEAKRQFLKAVLLDPKYAESYNNLGVIYLKQGQYQAAEDYCLKAIHLKPHSETPYNNMGVISIHQGRYDRAMKYITQALRLKPNYAKALNNLGIVFVRQGRYKQSLEHFARVLDLEPRNEEARRNFEEVSSKLKQLSYNDQ